MPISNKRAREEIEDTSPTLLVNQASTSTITEEPITVNANYLSPRADNKNQNSDELALKLNRLKDKSARYVSHEEFLTCCIENKLIPKGLELSLEPTIGNSYQEFIDNWYRNMKEFSFILVKDIVPFCGKTIEEAAKNIDEA